MSDAITTATRMNWAVHHEEAIAGLDAAVVALLAIQRHVGKPLDGRVKTLMEHVLSIRTRVDRGLQGILELQISDKKPL